MNLEVRRRGRRDKSVTDQDWTWLRLRSPPSEGWKANVLIVSLILPALHGKKNDLYGEHWFASTWTKRKIGPRAIHLDLGVDCTKFDSHPFTIGHENNPGKAEGGTCALEDHTSKSTIVLFSAM